ncbi:MAG: aminomethyl-transferring glycine dehydrogenase [Planctomycetes bacterium]|nr:aminomethyl-transferring glycine dehydrogenase [Planctomycetota bacterium]
MSSTHPLDQAFPRSDRFLHRHLGPRAADLPAMLGLLGAKTLDEMTEKAVPGAIRWRGDLRLPAARGEAEVLAELGALAAQNRVLRSYIGLGYHGTITPPVVQRNILENPGWYTQYTPYQAEISQGRMEALFHFQTMALELTGMEVANCSLLDEATAAAEAMAMCKRVLGKDGDERHTFLVATHCHPQTLAVLRTRAEPMGIQVRVADADKLAFDADVFGCLIQYPASDGTIADHSALVQRAHAAKALVVVATDLLALTCLTPPGEWGADMVVGNSQRFGVPMGFGGPHAAFLTARESHARQMPGRIIGLSRDAHGNPALRLALATREQHIRRDKATSNICTAQVLLAVMAAMYAIYHGPDGLAAIARRVHGMACALAEGLRKAGHTVVGAAFFDTVRVRPAKLGAGQVLAAALARGINLRDFGDGTVGVALDETANPTDVLDVLEAFGVERNSVDPAVLAKAPAALPKGLLRKSPYLTHPVFHRYHSEHEMLRYIHRLQAKDLSLTTSMIPLGSCTMKLNATSEMYPVSFPGFAGLHPFAPADQAVGYTTMMRRLEEWLCEITGFAACSLQPNAGSQGEYTGLLVIRAWHRKNGQEQRNVCLIPQSAHGTNPASAAMAGMKVVVVACDKDGNVDVADLKAKAEQHRDTLAALMITYPSTHGVFEEAVKRICALVHENGGQVYLDGANMNAQVGLMRPGDLGADVCHLNLHKTFCIPHGGGGPGMGPICVAAHLAPFLPGHPLARIGGAAGIGAVAAAPYGSPSILVIPYAYIAMMGPDGLTRATQVAILNANYVAQRLTEHYPVLYRGANGMVAHECILDLRPLKATSGVEAVDVAKRLMDYGFHAPTLSFPVAGTLMVEPTESESKEELDRFCDALIAIREEIRAIEQGKADRHDNVLKHAPHTAQVVCATEWSRPYPREQAAFPAPWTGTHKYWPAVSRVDDLYGDKNLVCACPPVESYAAS